MRKQRKEECQRKKNIYHKKIINKKKKYSFMIPK